MAPSCDGAQKRSTLLRRALPASGSPIASRQAKRFPPVYPQLCNCVAISYKKNALTSVNLLIKWESWIYVETNPDGFTRLPLTSAICLLEPIIEALACVLVPLILSPDVKNTTKSNCKAL